MVDKKRWKETAREIRRVLLEEWDPIEVRDEPLAQEEYDRYIGRIYRLLAENASDDELAAYLLEIETDWMGLTGEDDGRRVRTVKALRALQMANL